MNAPLLRAMRQFVQSRAKSPFYRRASRLEARSFGRIVDFFLAHRDEILHPDPRRAVSLGLLMAISVVYEIVVLPQDLSDWKGLLPRDDHALKKELCRAFLGYLDTVPARTRKSKSPR